jgi:hypothetical protein
MYKVWEKDEEGNGLPRGLLPFSLCARGRGVQPDRARAAASGRLKLIVEFPKYEREGV